MGESQTCVVTTLGSVKCWGNNVWGQLGDGTTAQRTAPVDVMGVKPPPTPTPCPTEGCPVGGVAELPEVARAPLEAGDSSGPGAAMLASVTAGVLAGAASISGAVWYTRRRLS